MDRPRGSAAATNHSSEATLQSCEIQCKILAATVLVVFIEYSTCKQPSLLAMNTGSNK
jgi:hypothetical protein